MPVRRMLILVLLALLLPQHSAAAPPEIRRLVGISTASTAVQTDHLFVVWTEQEAGGATRAIYAMPVNGGERSTVATGLPTTSSFEGVVVDPVIDNGIVVWVEEQHGQRAIRARHLYNGQLVTVATGAVSFPGLAELTVTWWEDVDPSQGLQPNPSPATLKSRELAFDLSTLGQPVVVTRTPNSAHSFGPSLTSLHSVVWAQPTGLNDTGLNFIIYAAPLSGGERRAVGSAWGRRAVFSLFSGRLVYHTGGSPNPAGGPAGAGALIEVDLHSGERRDLGQHGWIEALAINSRYIFWASMRSSSERSFYDLWGYDPLSNSAFLIAGGAEQSASSRPALASDRRTLVWSWDDTRESAIYTAVLDALLPSGRRPAPGAASPEQLYFPETGHTLVAGFRGFWEHSGGLPVFGYPLTEEFLERSADSDRGRTTQYLERQRFEYHPEHAGTPYVVLLGRLGVDLLRAQGRDWTTLPKARPSQPHYFTETGHAIAPQFYGYWSGHGLELGAPGISFRESLALFGFPISEPQLETNPDGDTVLTQWFERARFEYHPNNPAEHRVLLGRLGVELLGQRGW